MLDKIYDAASCEKEKIVIEGADHGDSYYVNTELYLISIRDFINKYIN